MINSNTHGRKKPDHFSDRTIFFLFSLSLMIIIIGVSGIIENKSPANLSTLWTIAEGFFTYIQYHALIIFGAFAFTISIWMASNQD